MIVRFASPSGPRIGYLNDGVVHVLPFRSIGDVARDGGSWSWNEAKRESTETIDLASLRLLAPVDDHMEVWGCGVTYMRSREAREDEGGTSRDIYTRVYDAPRPEIFYKGVGWRSVGHGSVATVRSDSLNCVPEPELALLVSPLGKICGFTICDDITARDLEAENPLYLPQAKIWFGSCALGPGIVPANEIADPYALAVTLTVERDGRTVFDGSSTTARLNRRLDDLAIAALHDHPQPQGFLLTTGTPIVPPWEFILALGDSVSISIDSVGTLTHSIGVNDTKSAA